MTKQTLNYMVDVLSTLVVMGLVATGLVVKYVLPGGGGGGSSRALWTLGRHDWGDLHFWIAVSGAVLVCLHVALHWNWVCVTTRNLIGLRRMSVSRLVDNICGFGLLIGLGLACVGFVSYGRSAIQNVSGGRGEGNGRGEGRNADVSGESFGNQGGAGEGRGGEGRGGGMIRGSMTLADAAHTLGHTPEELLAALKLPSSTPVDEKLGELRQQYNFSMSEVREAFSSSPATNPSH